MKKETSYKYYVGELSVPMKKEWNIMCFFLSYTQRNIQ